MGWIRRMLGGGLTEDDVERMELARDVKGLIKCFEDEEWWGVRQTAAKALGEIGDERGVEPLIKALGDEKSIVRRYAAKALEKIGDARAVEPLTKALSDDDEWVRDGAKEALRKLGHEVE